MNISTLSTVMKQNSLSQAVGIQLLKMSNDQATQQGQDLAKMMAQSVQPHVGGNLDIKI
ncbi:putative motility protein [Paenibacillus selenitireducens]|uniref:Putative motility protein n=1 Tax=Paenibacillus selenitireducens TaxID=1324314 RepID=A0A1T2XF81_9BACL|nr:YjfB family protein [Paenibacillus selenitireducens]OPA78510.1 putative motility protein [Paenibacillus selenitireducens]